MMEKSSRRFLGILALVACLLIGFGIYLIQRDLQVLVSQRSTALERSLIAAKALLPYELVELNLSSKNSASQAAQELSSNLLNILAELKLSGRLHVGLLREDGFQSLASSDTQNIGLMKLPTESFQNLTAGKNYVSPLLKQNDGRWMFLAAPLDEQSAILVLESNESGLFYQRAGILLHYILLAVGLVFLCGLAIYAVIASKRQNISRLAQSFSAFFDEGNQPAFIVNKDLQLLQMNPLALERFGIIWDDLSKRALSELKSLIPLETSWAEISAKLARGQNFRSTLKYMSPSEQLRYFRFKFCSLGNENLVLISDVTSKALLQTQDSSFFDPVTKLPNLQYFRSLMETQKERFQLEKHSLLLIQVLEISENPNAQLEIFVSFLKEYFRHNDFILQYQGASFLVILGGTDLESAYRIAQNLPRMLSESDRLELRKLSVNIGVSQFDADEHYQDWLNRAEAALMTARQAGRNRVEAQQVNALEILENAASSTSETA